MYNFSWFDITSLLLKFSEFYLERFAFLPAKEWLILLSIFPHPRYCPSALLSAFSHLVFIHWMKSGTDEIRQGLSCLIYP